MDARELRALLLDWNRDKADQPVERTFVQAFDERAAREPDRVAISENAGRALDYGALKTRSENLADGLPRHGVQAGRVVALLADRGLDFAAAMIGILRAGRVYLPLDPLHPPDRHRETLRQSGAVLLFSRAHADRAAQLEGERLALEPLFAHETIHLKRDHAPEPGAPAYVIFTSGSTGKPKGALVAHAGMLNHLRAKIDDLAINAQDRVAQNAPQSFDISVWQFLAPLMTGGQVIVIDDESARDPNLLLSRVAESELTILEVVPSLLRAMLEEPAPVRAGLARLRWLVPTGEALPPDLARQWLNDYPDTPLLNAYGPTECSDDVSHHVIASPPSADTANMPIGLPILNTRLYVLDRFLRPTAAGVAGELYVGGICVGGGYLGDPIRTATAFIPDPFCAIPGQRLYQTGDLVRHHMPDDAPGPLIFLGRVDHQVKIRGFRIELGEIESALTRHPRVAGAVVLGRASASGDQRLIAYIVPEREDDHDLSAELDRALREKLPHYMIPSGYTILSETPITPNGKIDRKALARMALPEMVTTDENRGAHSDPIAEMTGSIWAETLGRETIPRHADFFELGGHSLLATRIMARIREIFSVELPLRALFEAPTVAALADRIRAQRTGSDQRPRIETIARDGDLPVSFSQQRLWFLDQLEGSSAAYNIFTALRFLGPLQTARLIRSLAFLIERHESLRTVLPGRQGKPVQSVLAPERLAPSLIDLSGLEQNERESTLRRMAESETHRVFDLAKGPLFRSVLVRLERENHALLMTLHHIIADGWSLAILIRELMTVYRADSVEPDASSLAPLPFQFADFAAWQRDWLGGERLHDQQDYWRDQLSDAPALHALPTDRPRPPMQSYSGDRILFALHGPEHRAFKQLCAHRGATLFMGLEAAFALLVSRYAGQDDVVIGTPIANRHIREFEHVFGFFANTLVLRNHLAGSPTFGALLDRTRAMALDAYEHQDLPFEHLVETLQPERNTAYNPLFQIMFILQNAPVGDLTLPDLTLAPLEWGQRVNAKFDLTLTIEEDPDGLHGYFEYNTDLFDRETAQRMLDHYARLLDSIVTAPDQKITRLPLLSQAERTRQLLEWNQTESGYPCDRRAHDLFADRALAAPDRTALVSVTARGARDRISYDRLDRTASQASARLADHGLGPETVVALLGERSIPFWTTVLAIHKTGAAYFPLDPLHPAQRLAQILTDARPALLIVADAYLPLLDPAFAELGPARRPSVLSFDALFADSPVKRLAPRGGPENLAYIINTSGSTGAPKGAMVVHKGMLNHIFAKLRDTECGEDDIIPQNGPQCFDVSVWQFYGPLLLGAQCHILDDETARDPSLLLQAVVSRRISLLEVVPSQLGMLLEELVDRGPARPDLGHLRWMVPTGELLPPAMCRRWFELYPRIPMMNTYGHTECSDDEGHYRFYASPAAEVANIPVGAPIQNAQIYILDRELEPVPPGVAGEVHIGGLPVGRGYWRRPARTAGVFIPDPFNHPGRAGSAGRLYKTGDLAWRLTDGRICYLSRADFQVKIRGFRIELGEIEAALERHPAIHKTVVVAHQAPNRPGDYQLAAYLQPNRGKVKPEPSELAGFLAEFLPAYMVPGYFVLLDSLPLNANGKIDRKALPEPDAAAAAAPNTDRQAVTPTEELVASIWAEVLALDRVGVDANFFGLGGHSLLATQIFSRIRKVLDVDPPLRWLFESPTVAELASRIDALRAEIGGRALPRLLPVDRVEKLPLSFAQQRLWFLDQIQPGGTAYNLPAAMRLTGRLSVKALEQSLSELVRRHEAPRTVFGDDDGRAYQTILPARAMRAPLIDLSALAGPDRDRLADELPHAESARPFDLARGPLLRVTLLRYEPNRHILLITLHHIVSDAWSAEIMNRELAALYAAFRLDRPSPLPETPFQYADYAAWQRAWPETMLADELDYWRGQLAGVGGVQKLPRATPKPVIETRAAGHLLFRLDPALSQRLIALSRARTVTPFMLLLTAFKTLVHCLTGETDIVIGTDVANRNFREVEGIVGFFINQLILRSDFSGEPVFDELLERVRRVTLDAYAHQNLPYEQLIGELNPERAAGDTPFTSIKFVFHNIPAKAVAKTELSFEKIRVEAPKAKFDLMLDVWLDEPGFTLLWEYNADRYDAAAITDLWRQFETLLQALPDRTASGLPEFETLLRENEAQSARDAAQRLGQVRRGKLGKRRRKAVDLKA